VIQGSSHVNIKGVHMRRHTLSLVIIVSLGLWAAYEVSRPAAHAGMTPSRVPVLVELFTSEGCSDCPPADQVLAQLAGGNLVDGVDVIAMSEHVDYWNNLGWSDPFSDAQFTDRQNEYAQAFRNRDIYTPQMIVDGQLEFVGSNRAQAIQAVKTLGKQAKDPIDLSVTTRDKEFVKLQVRIEPGSSPSLTEPAEVFLAVTENNLFSNVVRGENQGRKLTHIAVVRQLTPIGKIGPGAAFTATPVIRLSSQWKVRDLRVVAFVQATGNRHILAVSSVPVFPEG
jgi:hypothetical protein